ncbi:hypothetical protein [Elioraea sp.]|uniref:hypothetical protein n=1 Tax=Elioraea sp. TaxID=2185103 RepID=UPI003F725E71
MLQVLHLDGADRPVAVLVEGPALRLRRQGIADVFAPLPRLARVVVHGPRVQWRTEALMACLEGGVPVLFLGARGTLAGALVPVHPPAARADLAALLDAAASAPGFRRRLEDFCRAEERNAILALVRREGGGSCDIGADLRPAAVRRRCLEGCVAPAVAAALANLMSGLASAMVAEALARRGAGPQFLMRRTGGFGLAEALGRVLAWHLWPPVRSLAATAELDAAGVLMPPSRRAAIRAFETAELAPRRDRLLARLAAVLAESL